MRPISPELQKLVAENEHITEVHFDEKGDHHLNAYDEEIPIKNDKGEFMLKADKTILKKKTGKTVAGGGKKRIVETISRENILNFSKGTAPATEDKEEV